MKKGIAFFLSFLLASAHSQPIFSMQSNQNENFLCQDVKLVILSFLDINDLAKLLPINKEYYDLITKQNMLNKPSWGGFDTLTLKNQNYSNFKNGESKNLLLLNRRNIKFVVFESTKISPELFKHILTPCKNLNKIKIFNCPFNVEMLKALPDTTENIALDCRKIDRFDNIAENFPKKLLVLKFYYIHTFIDKETQNFHKILKILFKNLPKLKAFALVEKKHYYLELVSFLPLNISELNVCCPDMGDYWTDKIPRHIKKLTIKGNNIQQDWLDNIPSNLENLKIWMFDMGHLTIDFFTSISNNFKSLKQITLVYTFPVKNSVEKEKFIKNSKERGVSPGKQQLQAINGMKVTIIREIVVEPA